MQLAFMLGVVACLSMASAQTVNPASTEVDEEALAALDPPFIATPDTEYSPLFAQADQVAVRDVGTGILAETALECAEHCAMTEDCNAVSYVADPTWTEDANCYPKELAETCAVPDGAATAPDFFFMIAQVEGCPSVEGLPVNDPVETRASIPGMGPTATATAISGGSAPTTDDMEDADGMALMPGTDALAPGTDALTPGAADVPGAAGAVAPDAAGGAPGTRSLPSGGALGGADGAAGPAGSVAPLPDGVDPTDVAVGDEVDTNGDGTPDAAAVDSNGDGVVDGVESTADPDSALSLAGGAAAAAAVLVALLV